MAKPYSADLRTRVAAAIAQGETCRSIAERFHIAPSTVVKWSKRVRERAARRRPSSAATRRVAWRRIVALFLAHIEKVPHLTLHRLKDLLAAERGVVVSHDTVWRFLRGEGRCSPATSSSSTISAAIAQAPSARPSSAPVQD